MASRGLARLLARSVGAAGQKGGAAAWLSSSSGNVGTCGLMEVGVWVLPQCQTKSLSFRMTDYVLHVSVAVWMWLTVALRALLWLLGVISSSLRRSSHTLAVMRCAACPPSLTVPLAWQ